ncbi:unnamed protein product [Phyllotreta striolata]|uniref:Aminopeptidase n=1 Tax=Phyllotreta striolata TaxID=444603 RepID=A0A9N9XQN2_PHYSR|nr:unnamed protein product [Phyllotreta striolata]
MSSTIRHLLTILFFVSFVNSQTNFRLPKSVLPQQYNLLIDIRNIQDRDNFRGGVTITMDVVEPTKNIVLHFGRTLRLLSKPLLQNISDINVKTTTDTNVEVLTITDANGNNFEKGSYTLSIQYEAAISTSILNGIYRSSYIDKENTKYIVATQFQPTFARRAFPCFDEPEFKAIFKLTFMPPQGITVITNTKKEKESSIGTMRTIEFAETPKMSTHMVAFVASQFDCTASTTTVQSSVCSVNRPEEERQLAAEEAPGLLQALIQYTGVNYEDNKLEHVALPDLLAESMGHWGLITYREDNLLYHPEKSSSIDKQKVVGFLAHDIAYQWFGNLVTPTWWSDLFLNEGFARYFENIAIEQTHPDWQMDKQFVINTVQKALRNDESAAFPLQQSLSDISSVFNSVTYLKGGSIIRMVEHVLGADAFKNGVSAYIKNFQHSTTSPKNLWAELNKISNLPYDLQTVMENWTKQPGFPLLNVTTENRQVTVTQKQISSNNDLTTQWYVPITYTTSADEFKFQTTSPQLWLTPNDNAVKFNLPDGAEWLVLNNKQSGFYRVNYDEAGWDSIEVALKLDNFGGIGELNRAAIVDDLFSLAKLNVVTYSRVFKLLEFLKNEGSYYTWSSAFEGFGYILDRVGLNSTLGDYVTKFALTHMEKFYNSTPFQNIQEDDQIFTLKQNLAHKWACILGHTDCIDKSKSLFKAFNINLKSTVICSALRESTVDFEWDLVWSHYEKSTMVSEKNMFLESLSCTKKTEQLKTLLNLTLQDTFKGQYGLFLFSKVLNNPYGVDLALEFFFENYEKIFLKYQDINLRSSILQLIGSKITTAETYNKLKDFVTTNLSNSQEGQEALNIAETNKNWLKRSGENLLKYFEPPIKNAATIPASFAIFLLPIYIIFVLFN